MQITFYALSEHAFNCGPSRSSAYLLLLYAVACVSAETSAVADAAFAAPVVVSMFFAYLALRCGFEVSHAVTILYIILNRAKMPSSLAARLIIYRVG